MKTSWGFREIFFFLNCICVMSALLQASHPPPPPPIFYVISALNSRRLTIKLVIQMTIRRGQKNISLCSVSMQSCLLFQGSPATGGNANVLEPPTPFVRLTTYCYSVMFQHRQGDESDNAQLTYVSFLQHCDCRADNG